MRNQLCIVETAAERFLPLTYFRPVYDLRCGILTLRDKILHAYAGAPYRLYCRDFLATTVQASTPAATVNEWPVADCLIVNGRVLAPPDLAKKIPLDLDSDIVFINDHEVVAVRASAGIIGRLAKLRRDENPLDMFDDLPHVSVDVATVSYPWDLLTHNGSELEQDAYHLHEATFGVEHLGKVHDGAILEWPDRITIEEGAVIKPGAVLDAEQGPIVVAKNATVMSGAVVEGPAYIGRGSVIKVHAKIYGQTTIGPICKVGGEVECSIIHGYSNKQHDGFLGHSYVGEWVNLGAGTNNSDLKNNYGHIRMQIGNELIDTGLRFMGMLMADHSKSGIGCTFNTGTVIGPGCNIFGAGLPPKFIPAFAWGGAAGFATYELDRCMQVARTVMGRRNVEFGQTEEALFRAVFEMTREERVRAGMEALLAV